MCVLLLRFEEQQKPHTRGTKKTIYRNLTAAVLLPIYPLSFISIQIAIVVDALAVRLTREPLAHKSIAALFPFTCKMKLT